MSWILIRSEDSLKLSIGLLRCGSEDYCHASQTYQAVKSGQLIVLCWRRWGSWGCFLLALLISVSGALHWASGTKTTGEWIYQKSSSRTRICVIMNEWMSVPEAQLCRISTQSGSCCTYFFVSRRQWPLPSAVYGAGRPGSLLLLPRILSDDRRAHMSR